MKHDINQVIEAYIEEHTDDVSPLLHQLIEETEHLTERSRWSIGRIEGKLLEFPGWRVEAAVPVLSPAADVACQIQRTGEVPLALDLHERSGGLEVQLVAETHQRAVDPKGARPLVGHG